MQRSRVQALLPCHVPRAGALVAAAVAAAVGLAVAAAAHAAVAAADAAVAAVAATSVLHDWRELVRWNLRLVLLLRRLLPVRRLRLRQRVGPERRKILLQEPYR